MLLLNELSDEPHNLPVVRLVASRTTARGVALRGLRRRGLASLPNVLRAHITRLLTFLFLGGVRMEHMETEFISEGELRPGKMVELVKIMAELLPQEDVLEGILAKFDHQRILAKITPEERLAGLGAEAIEAYLRKLREKKGDDA